MAGTTRAAGEPAFSATDNSDGVCIAAVSIRTAPSDMPANPLQVVAASPSQVAALAQDSPVSELKTAIALARGKLVHLMVSSFPRRSRWAGTSHPRRASADSLRLL
ncbi:major facilitator superfamily protein [Bradyrhizobium oligotrophicum S58]|uniref:Major facilitator superfamily protein n=1 Tax=Bradyrhizobium oligotrophicum S58 TaxID=1245469 RepID=M4ZXT4_9BRAD|nr:major facilitator superfamily protein [Bradyrhizobium oligotrophicum S58]